MAKEIKGFITRDDFVLSSNAEVSPLYELSDIAYTYSKDKKIYNSFNNSLYALHVFKHTEVQTLLQSEVEDIIEVVRKFSEYLTASLITNKQQSIIVFTNDFNLLNPSKAVSEFSYNTVVSHQGIKSVDYVTFKINGISCSLWLSDEVFRAFYPDYDINIVLPFSNFQAIVSNTSEFIAALEGFDLIEFNRRVEENKNDFPATYTKIINIPYRVPNSSVTKNCYFAFNIYGLQGNYDYILKLELYSYLTTVLGLEGSYVESIFPTILNINEFFLVPRWDAISIPSQVGQSGINSQIFASYSQTFDQDKFIKVYTDTAHLRANTYNVPFDYNNIMLQVTNGYYTEMPVRDFKTYYNDLITVTSTHPDFARMKPRTQRFVTLMESMLDVSNANNATEMFNKVLQNENYRFSIITRGGVNYISIMFEDHQLYMVPKYEVISRL